jgi:hypothetical protein
MLKSRAWLMLAMLLGSTAELCLCAVVASASDGTEAGPSLWSPAHDALSGSGGRAASGENDSPGGIRAFFEIEGADSESGACAAALDADELRRAPSLLVCADEEVRRSLKIKSDAVSTGFGSVEFHAAMGKLATVDSLTTNKLLFDYQNGSHENTALSVGFVDRLFDGRFTFSSDFSWAHDSSVWRDESDSSSTYRSGAARWHRFDARLIDTPTVRWLASGEMSSVDVGYTANSGARPKMTLSVPGERERFSTSLRIWDTTLSGVSERLDSPFQMRALDRVKLGIDGVELDVTARRIERSSFLEPGIRTSRSESTSVALEFMPELLVPETMVELDDLASLVPNLISLDWETGRDTALTGTMESQSISGFQALLNWSGKLGETTALYWREDQVPLGASEGAETGFSQILDVSHTIKRGDWRVGFGVSMFDLQSSSQAEGYADAAVSGTFSVAYAPTHGPKVQFGVGHNRDEFEFEEEDDAFRQDLKALNLSLSVDLSNFIQKALDRPKLKLEAEYRHNLNHAEATDTRPEQDGAEAFLASFRAPL